MSKPNNPKAFPRPASEYTAQGTLPDGNDAIPEQDGMTLRDWFAGQAIIPLTGIYSTDEERQAIAIEAYKLADALLAERAKS